VIHNWHVVRQGKLNYGKKFISIPITWYTHPVALVNLLVRKPLARLEILLLERRIQHTQAPYLACARRIVAFDVRFGFAVRGLQGEGSCGL
jgi:hypothetical protein